MSTPLPGGLGRLRVHDGMLHLEVLDDDGHHLEVSVPVDDGQRHALHHLHAALHRCDESARPLVDVLFASLAAVDARATALRIAAGPPTTFALLTHGPWGAREVALDVVDAAALIFSRRVPLQVAAPGVDWDRELGQLLA